MEDRDIVALYWQRDESALARTEEKYGRYCLSIAGHILSDGEDAKEAVNDTWLGAWNSIPPQRPAVLSTYLGKLTRRIAINRWQERHAAKRGGGETALVLGELAECVPSGQSVERTVELAMLSRAVDDFVQALGSPEQQVFICRYWYMDPIGDICRRFGFSQSKVKSMLSRTRQKLLSHLEKEGFTYDA